MVKERKHLNVDCWIEYKKELQPVISEKCPPNIRDILPPKDKYV